MAIAQPLIPEVDNRHPGAVRNFAFNFLNCARENPGVVPHQGMFFPSLELNRSVNGHLCRYRFKSRLKVQTRKSNPEVMANGKVLACVNFV